MSDDVKRASNSGSIRGLSVAALKQHGLQAHQNISNAMKSIMGSGGSGSGGSGSGSCSCSGSGSGSGSSSSGSSVSSGNSSTNVTAASGASVWSTGKDALLQPKKFRASYPPPQTNKSQSLHAMASATSMAMINTAETSEFEPEADYSGNDRERTFECLDAFDEL